MTKTKTAEFYANRNIKLYSIAKIFTKRVFLPLSAIYFIEVGGLALQDIGFLAAIFAGVQLLFEVPTGLFADKVGRARAMQISAILLISATLLYVLVQSKTGIYLGMFCEALGYTFLTGASEAIVHDSLVVVHKEKFYTKILGRAQSIALIANALLVGLVPLTYGIDKRLPFLIGTAAFSILLIVAFNMHDVGRHTTDLVKQRIEWIHLRKRHVVLFAMLFGVVGAVYIAPSDFFNIALKEFGLQPQYLGWIFASASIVGAVFGLFIDKLKRFGIERYAFIDVVILCLPFLATATRSVSVVGVAVIINIAFWRYRRIIYQDYLLNKYSTRYKATLLSAMSNLEGINSLWVPIVVSMAIAQFGLSTGLTIFGLGCLLLIPIYTVSAHRFFATD